MNGLNYFIMVLSAVVGGLTVFMVFRWLSGLKKAGASGERVRLLILPKNKLIYCAVWLVITGGNIILKLKQLSDETLLREDIAAREYDGARINGYAVGETKDMVLGRIDSKLLGLRLGIVFYVLCFAAFVIYLIVIRSASLTPDGLYWGFMRYKPQNISYIMEEGMECPVLVDRISGRDLGVRSVKDSLGCRRILTENYGSAKYYSEREEQSPNEIGSQTED